MACAEDLWTMAEACVEGTYQTTDVAGHFQVEI